MTALPRLLLAAALALLVIPAIAPALAGPSAGPVPAPRAVALPAGDAGRVALPSGAPSPALGAVSSAPSASGPSPAAPAGCPGTPSGTPNWNGNPNFFADAVVNVAVPGQPGLSGSSFAIAPCSNTIPTYQTGFWVNASTNVPIYQAFVTIWGTNWPTPTNALPDLPGFPPSNPVRFPMFVQAPLRHTASFYFNVYRYFWPGSQVYFNVSLQSTNATPSTIYSTNSLYIQPFRFSGGVDNWTWAFNVASPFVSTNFSQDIAVATTPSVLTVPAFEPNDQQQLQIVLQSINASGGAALPIPAAQAWVTLTGRTDGLFQDQFVPINHTYQKLQTPIGPYPGTHVDFNITAWFPWEGGAIDRIYSVHWKFNWSDNGGWWNPTGGLQANLEVAMSPNLTALGQTGSTPTLPSGVPINVTVHSPKQNVTIAAASIHYRYTDANGEADGVLAMRPVTANTSYGVIAGLPPGGQMTFSISAKDINGDPIASGNFSYAESGPLGTSLNPGYGLFYFETIDVGRNVFVPNVNFTIANDTWSEKGVGTPFGFAMPVPVSGGGYLPVAFGTYTVTVSAFGQTQTWSGTISDQNPFVVLFYVTSQPVGATFAAPILSLTAPAGVGILGAAIAMIPVRNWFKERRAKAEAEQRRITL